MSGDPQPSTYSIAGPVDYCSEGHQEMMRAVEDGAERVMVIKLPQDSGMIVMPIDVSSYSESFEMGAAISFSGGGTVKGKAQYLVCAGCA